MTNNHSFSWTKPTYRTNWGEPLGLKQEGNEEMMISGLWRVKAKVQ
jgi:hypothetical protein